MGPISSVFTKHSTDIKGSNNDIWIVNGINFNMSSTFHQMIQNMSNTFQNILITNNKTIIISIVLLSTIIILPIVIWYLKNRYQQITSNTNCSIHTLIISVDLATSNTPSVSKKLTSCTTGHIT